MTYIIITILLILIFFKIMQLILSPLHKMPGPRCYNPLGNLISIATQKHPCQIELGWATKYINGLCSFRITPFKYAIFIGDNPGALKHIFITNSKNYKLSKMVDFAKKLFFGEGLLTMNSGQEHDKDKKYLAQAFTIQQLKYHYLPVFIDRTRFAIHRWINAFKLNQNENENQKEMEVEVDINILLKELTMDILGLCAFNYDFKAIGTHIQSLSTDINNNTNDISLYTKYNTILECIQFNAIMQLFIPYYYLLPTPLNNKAKQAQNDIKCKIHEIIKTRRQHQDVSVDQNDHHRNQEEKSHNNCQSDLLSIMLGNNKDVVTFSESKIVDNILTFMIAGHETSGVALSWMLYFLAQHHTIQEKLFEEIREIKSLDSTNLHLDLDLDPDDYYLSVKTKLPYLEAFIKECFRMQSPSPAFVRRAIKDDVIDGYKIPKGTEIWCYSQVFNHIPKYWDNNPHIFNPDRWIMITQDEKDEKGNIDKDHKYMKSFNFGIGNRSCIAQQFSYLEISTILIELISKFKFTITEQQLSKIRCKQIATMQPFPHMKLNIKLRK